MPKGVHDGVTLRMQGKGNMSVQGEAQNGDLLIKVKVRPHASFERDGPNVLTQCKITVATAILGGKVKVQTLSGESELVVKPGTACGT